MSSHDFYEVNGNDLGSIVQNVAHAKAMVANTYGHYSHLGFQQLPDHEQADYLWAIYARLKVASRALARVMERSRFDSADEAVNAEGLSDV